MLRRLNRLEYVDSLRNLFGIEFPLAAELPADSVAAGFDNIGAAQEPMRVRLDASFRTRFVANTRDVSRAQLIRRSSICIF